MATYNTNIALIEKTTPVVRRFAAGERFPKVFVAEATYTWLATEAVSDFIDIVKLPQGAAILPYLSNVTTVGAPAATLTIDIGDELNEGANLLDVDAYADGLNVAAAGNDLFTSGTQPAAQNVARVLIKDAMIRAQIITLTTPAGAGATFRFQIFYTCLHAPSI